MPSSETKGAGDMTIELGKKARDTVSGFVGVTVAFTKWLNGCVRWGLQPPVDKDGKLPDAQWFDEPQLIEVPDEPLKAGPSDVGGPMPSIPQRHADPQR
jgi:hypothetical protein